MTKVQEKYNAAQTAHQTQQDNLRGFVQQTENRLRDLQKKLQDFVKKQQDFTTKLDQALQTLEQEIGKNNGFVASLSSGNALAKKELVAQKRVSLLQGLKQVEANLSQLDQEVSSVINETGQGFQQAQKDGDPVRTNLQDLLMELSNLDRELKNSQFQQETALAGSQPAPQTVAQGITGAPATGVDMEVLTKLGQAEVALLALKQGLGKSRLMQQVVYNINDFGHRCNLQ